MHATLRPSTNGHARGTRPPAALDSHPTPPPLIRLFPRDASPSEPVAPSLPQGGEFAPQGTGPEVWYAVFLSAFLIGLLALGGCWIWLNVRFL